MFRRCLLAFSVFSASLAAAQVPDRTEDFEAAAVGSLPAEWNGDALKSFGWSAEVVEDVASSGRRSLHLVPSTTRGRDHAFTWTIDAAPFRNSVIALNARVKGGEGEPQLRLLVKRPGHGAGFEGELDGAAGEGWSARGLEAGVAPDATSIVLSIRPPRDSDKLAQEWWIDDIGVRRIAALDERPYELRLHPASLTSAPNTHPFALRSEKLSRFWGRDITLHAAVVAPPDVDLATLPVCYFIHGFGGDHTMAWTFWPMMASTLPDKGGHVLYVMLDASCPLGHHEFADSVNNGPCGAALVEELIPALEAQYGGVRPASKRFVSGHSSGGWCALWLQVTYPDSFGGCWATSPDPVDFRDWSGIDLYAETNVFRDSSGTARPLIMQGTQVRQTVEGYVKGELAISDYGGQIASFDAVFSPRGDDGRPMQVFDRRTGAIDRSVVEAWKRYDIGLILRTRWSELGPKLAGKIHVWCGEEDTFRLQGAVKLLQKDLAVLKSDADVLLIPGRDHGSIFAPHEEFWPKGMVERINREIIEKANR